MQTDKAATAIANRAIKLYRQKGEIAARQYVAEACMIPPPGIKSAALHGRALDKLERLIKKEELQ